MPANPNAEKIVAALLDPETPKEVLVKHFTQWTESAYGPGIDRAVQLRAARQIQSAVDQLSVEIRASSESSNRLGERLWWLNLILAIATGVIAVVGIVQLFVPPPQ